MYIILSILGFVFGLFALAASINLRQNRQIVNLLPKLNQALNFEMTPVRYGFLGKIEQFPQLSHRSDSGREIVINRIQSGTSFFGINVSCKAAYALSFSIRQQDRIFELKPERDIELRDEEFDKLFFIESNNKAKLKEYFYNPDIRTTFIEIHPLLRSSRIYYQSDKLFFESSDASILKSPEKIKLLMNALVQLSEHIAQTESGESPASKEV